MALSCERHTAHIYDRGGMRRIGVLDNIIEVDWARERDETTVGKVIIGNRRSDECDELIRKIATVRNELVVFRGGIRVWEGPITLIEHKKAQTTISAKDITFYPSRAIMKREYDNRYPNIRSVADHMGRVLVRELARFEAQVPPINVLPYVVIHESADGEDAGTSSYTLPYQFTVHEHMENLAARGGLDYTVLGRALHLWDVHNPAMGQTAIMTENDIVGEVVITEYGNELATVAAVTDGKGRWGEVDESDDYYGIVERLETAFDEQTGNEWDDPDNPNPPSEPPSETEMRSQAQRLLAGKRFSPVVVRVPDNSGLNPNGVLNINELVPGIRIPLQAKLPGRTISQLQVLHSLRVKETASEGETISITMSPAPGFGIEIPDED